MASNAAECGNVGGSGWGGARDNGRDIDNDPYGFGGMSNGRGGYGREELEYVYDSGARSMTCAPPPPPLPPRPLSPSSSSASSSSFAQPPPPHNPQSQQGPRQGHREPPLPHLRMAPPPPPPPPPSYHLFNGSASTAQAPITPASTTTSPATPLPLSLPFPYPSSASSNVTAPGHAETGVRQRAFQAQSGRQSDKFWVREQPDSAAYHYHPHYLDSSVSSSLPSSSLSPIYNNHHHYLLAFSPPAPNGAVAAHIPPASTAPSPSGFPTLGALSFSLSLSNNKSTQYASPPAQPVSLPVSASLGIGVGGGGGPGSPGGTAAAGSRSRPRSLTTTATPPSAASNNLTFGCSSKDSTRTMTGTGTGTATTWPGASGAPQDVPEDLCDNNNKLQQYQDEQQQHFPTYQYHEHHEEHHTSPEQQAQIRRASSHSISTDMTNSNKANINPDASCNSRSNCNNGGESRANPQISARFSPAQAQAQAQAQVQLQVQPHQHAQVQPHEQPEHEHREPEHEQHQPVNDAFVSYARTTTTSSSATFTAGGICGTGDDRQTTGGVLFPGACVPGMSGRLLHQARAPSHSGLTPLPLQSQSLKHLHYTPPYSHHPLPSNNSNILSASPTATSSASIVHYQHTQGGSTPVRSASGTFNYIGPVDPHVSSSSSLSSTPTPGNCAPYSNTTHTMTTSFQNTRLASTHAGGGGGGVSSMGAERGVTGGGGGTLGGSDEGGPGGPGGPWGSGGGGGVLGAAATVPSQQGQELASTTTTTSANSRPGHQTYPSPVCHVGQSGSTASVLVGSSQAHGPPPPSSHAAAAPAATSSAQAQASSNHSGSRFHAPSVIMPPLPEHIEAGIMGSSTWLLQPNNNHNNPHSVPRPPPPYDHSQSQQQQQQQHGQVEDNMATPSGSGQHASAAAAAPAGGDGSPASLSRPVNNISSSHFSSSSNHTNSTPNTYPSSSQAGPSHHHQSSSSSSSSIITIPHNPNPLTGPTPFPPLANPAPPAPDPVIINPNSSSQDFGGWRLAVEPVSFNSGLEGISGLPLEIYHATSAVGGAPPPHPSADMHHDPTAQPASYEVEVSRLEDYLSQLIALMAPFALTPSNPSPPPPPAYLHTRLMRFASLMRETLANIEVRSQPNLDAAFSLRPPGNAEATEAEREMLQIRRRRQELQEKAAAGKRDFAPLGRPRPMPGPGQPYPGSLDRRAPLAPRPPRDAWRCHGCGATHTTAWMNGPDGPKSLCDNCGYHYDRLQSKRDGGDGDFSSVPPPMPYNPHNMIGLNR